jgi:hypothetical protein
MIDSGGMAGSLWLFVPWEEKIGTGDQECRPTHCAQGAIFRRNFCIAMTFGLPTSSSVAQACRLSEDRVVMSKSMRRRCPTPL